MSSKPIDIEGKNIDIAIEKACREFGVPREKLNIEIISEGSGGFLGFGGKRAKIRASLLSLDMDFSLDAPSSVLKKEPTREANTEGNRRPDRNQNRKCRRKPDGVKNRRQTNPSPGANPGPNRKTARPGRPTPRPGHRLTVPPLLPNRSRHQSRIRHPDLWYRRSRRRRPFPPHRLPPSRPGICCPAS